MRFVLLLSVVVTLAAIALHAQTSASSADQIKKLPSGSCFVAGRVTAVDGVPLKSAQVVLFQTNAGRNREVYGATTDFNGVFILRAVAPGRYTFLASHTGYVPQGYESQGEDIGAILSLQPGQQVKDVLFRLTPAAVITGYVVDENNQPIVNIRVTAARRPSPEQYDDSPVPGKPNELVLAGAARTDDRGAYRIFGLQSGDYYLRADEAMWPPNDDYAAEGYMFQGLLGRKYASVYYPGVPQRSQAEVVSLRPGEEVQVDFSLHHTKTVEVSGRVFGPDGKPANAMVRLAEEEEGYSDQLSGSTDSEGNFTIKGVMPGSYVLMAYQQGTADVHGLSARQKVQVGNESIGSVIISIGRGTDLSGRVTFDGSSASRPNHIHLGLQSIGGTTWGYGVNVKQDGNFEMKGLQDGDYAIVFYSGGEGWYIKSAHLGTDDILTDGLHIGTGSRGTLEIVMSAVSAQLEGSVTRDDRGVAGAQVRIFADPETPYNRTRRKRTTTDQHGRFLLIGIAPGKYRVTARSLGDSGTGAMESAAQFVTLSERERKAIQLKLVAPQNQ
jgi:protocatechuate 3,4-dioxygenase beta subunit